MGTFLWDRGSTVEPVEGLHLAFRFRSSKLTQFINGEQGLSRFPEDGEGIPDNPSAGLLARTPLSVKSIVEGPLIDGLILFATILRHILMFHDQGDRILE